MNTNKIKNKKKFYNDGFVYLNNNCVKQYINQFKKVIFSVYKKGFKKYFKIRSRINFTLKF